MSPLLFALFLATFAIGTTEFAVVGLLPDIAASLDVSISRAGLLVSGYALGVAIGGPVIVARGRRFVAADAGGDKFCYRQGMWALDRSRVVHGGLGRDALLRRRCRGSRGGSLQYAGDKPCLDHALAFPVHRRGIRQRLAHTLLVALESLAEARHGTVSGSRRAEEDLIRL